MQIHRRMRQWKLLLEKDPQNGLKENVGNFYWPVSSKMRQVQKRSTNLVIGATCKYSLGKEINIKMLYWDKVVKCSLQTYTKLM